MGRGDVIAVLKTAAVTCRAVAGGITGRIGIGNRGAVRVIRRGADAGGACGSERRAVRRGIGDGRCCRRGSRGITHIDLKGNEAVDRINHQRPAITGDPGERLRQRHWVDTAFVVRPRLTVEPPDLRVGVVCAGECPTTALQQLFQPFLNTVGIDGLEHHGVQAGKAVIHRPLLNDGVTVAVVGLCLRAEGERQRGKK